MKFLLFNEFFIQFESARAARRLNLRWFWFYLQVLEDLFRKDNVKLLNTCMTKTAPATDRIVQNLNFNDLSVSYR